MKESGIKLTIEDIDSLATKIADMHVSFNRQRETALRVSQEVREYVFATDVETTSSSNSIHKNRTHIPKLTELSDTLQSNYWEAIFGESRFFVFDGDTSEDMQKAEDIEEYLRHKLEVKKFRQIEGRKAVADYVLFGNAFFETDYVKELDKNGNESFKGSIIRRISPLDITFDAFAPSFDKTPKIVRMLVHISRLEELARKFPNANFDKAAISKIVKSRVSSESTEWADKLHEHNLQMDGFRSWQEYFAQDFVEILVYRGDIFDNKTGNTQKRRIIWVADRLFVIRNEENPAPINRDGLTHVPWRVRPDNLWGMGALDNLLGMQYRVNKVENAKADALDLSVAPITILKSTDSLIDVKENLYKPYSVITIGVNEDIIFESPDTQVLQYATQHLAEYFALMENFAGAPAEERGIRTPGEKTAAEVKMLDSKSSKLFKDKTKAFEIALEGALDEAKELLLNNFDETDYIEVFNDIEASKRIKTISADTFKARGRFKAIGSKHWDIKNKKKLELTDLFNTFFQDPKFRAHIDGWEAVQLLKDTWDLADTNIFQRYRGVKEDVELQAIAQAEMQQLAAETQGDAGGLPEESGQPAPDNSFLS